MVPSKFEESLVDFSTACECAEANAIGKAQEVAEQLKVSSVCNGRGYTINCT